MAAPTRIDYRDLPPEERPAPATGFILGFMSAGLSGLLGFAAATFLEPALAAVRLFSPDRAVGTAVTTMAPAVIVSALTYHFTLLPRGGVPLDLVAVAAVGAVAGTAIANYIWKMAGAATPAIRQAAAAAGALAAAGLIALAFWGNLARSASEAGWLLLLLSGGLAGLMSALLGVGGVFTVPVFVLALGLDQHVAQGMALGVTAVTSAMVGWVHIRRGVVAANLTTSLLLGGLLGGWLLAMAALLLPGSILRGVYGAALLVISLQVWRRMTPPAAVSAEASAAEDAPVDQQDEPDS